jgi:hypothetical protein
MNTDEEEDGDEDDFDKEFESIVKKQKDRELAAAVSKTKAVVKNVRSSSTNQAGASNVLLPTMAPSKLDLKKPP